MVGNIYKLIRDSCDNVTRNFYVGTSTNQM